ARTLVPVPLCHAALQILVPGRRCPLAVPEFGLRAVRIAGPNLERVDVTAEVEALISTVHPQRDVPLADGIRRERHVLSPPVDPRGEVRFVDAEPRARGAGPHVVRPDQPVAAVV